MTRIFSAFTPPLLSHIRNARLNHEEHPELNMRTYLTGQAKKK